MRMTKVLTVLICMLLTITATLAQDKGEQLYVAVTKNNTEAAAKLLKEGANPNFVKESGWMKSNVLITAVNTQNVDVVTMLLDHKADVHWKDGFKTSAIMYAAHSGRIDILKLLLEHGANIHDSDGEGNTVWTAAKESKNGEMLAFVEAKLKEKKSLRAA